MPPARSPLAIDEAEKAERYLDLLFVTPAVDRLRLTNGLADFIVKFDCEAMHVRRTASALRKNACHLGNQA